MHTKVSEGDWVMGGGHPVYLPHLLRPAGVLDSPARGDTRMYRLDSGYSDVDGRGSSRMSDRDSHKS